MVANIAIAPRRIAHISAALGAMLWIATLPVAPSGGTVIASITHLTLFAILVCIPLGLPLTALSDPRPSTAALYRLAVLLQPPAALCALAASRLPPGAFAAGLALPWAAWTALAALWGLRRLTMHGMMAIEELCIDAGLLFLPIGGGWFALVRAGLDPGGFGTTIDALVALHYHYAGFAAPLLAGMAGRQIVGRGVATHAGRVVQWIFRGVAAGVCAGPLLIAAGTILAPVLALSAVIVLALSLIGLALLVWLPVRRAVRGWSARVFLGISSCAVMCSMGLGVAYAGSDAAGHPVLTIPRMIALHGLANAFGFVLCGLLGWTAHAAPSPRPAPAPSDTNTGESGVEPRYARTSE